MEYKSFLYIVIFFTTFCILSKTYTVHGMHTEHGIGDAHGTQNTDIVSNGTQNVGILIDSGSVGYKNCLHS